MATAPVRSFRKQSGIFLGLVGEDRPAMTLLGKIFTVLIFIMSVAFCILAVVTFATHKNWKDQALKLKTTIEQLEAKNLAQQQETLRAKGELAIEQSARRSALATLQVKLALLAQDLDNNAKVLRDQTSALTVQTQAAKTAEDTLASITAEVGKLRNEIRLAQQERDETYVKTVGLTDKLNQAESLRERLEELNRQLQDQYAQLNRVATARGITANDVVSHIPPKLDGVVTAVDEAKGLVEISLGGDDGLKRGHVLQVISGNTYLGQIILRQVGPDKAVGDIDKKMQRGRIKKGDNVTTKLS
jgi:hypothetical protein